MNASAPILSPEQAARWAAANATTARSARLDLLARSVCEACGKAADHLVDGNLPRCLRCLLADQLAVYPEAVAFVASLVSRSMVLA